MKKKIKITLLILLIVPTIVNAASKAYSVGTKWADGTYAAGSDFRTNVNNASNAYGWLEGYTSYYSTDPNYNYMKGSRLGSSQAYFINGHANYDVIEVASRDTDSYRTGISIYQDGYTSYDTTGDKWTYAGLSGRSMSGTKIITFVGCKTGYQTNNLVKKAVTQGATAAVGFDDDITSRSTNGIKWLKKYNNLLGNGYTLQRSISGAITAYPELDLSATVVTSGDTSIRLGTLATSTSNYVTNINVQDIEELEFYQPPEKVYKHIKLTENIEYDFSYIETEKQKNQCTKNDESIEKIKKIILENDEHFNISNYKIKTNVVSEENKYGYIFLTYYINDMIETNKVYLIEIFNGKVENIILAGIKEKNEKNSTNLKESEILEKINDYNNDDLNSRTKNINNLEIVNNMKKYFYDYNTKELSLVETNTIKTVNNTFYKEEYSEIISD